MIEIIEHLEHHLGEFESAQSLPNNKDIVVLKFANTPNQNISTYITVGLSSHLLSLGQDKSIRQELVVSVYEDVPQNEISSFLLTLCEYLLSKHQGLLRGEFIGPYKPIIANVHVNSIYATIPTQLQQELWNYRLDEFDNVIFSWLIPILPEEVDFINGNGWEAFESLLESTSTDVFDVNRQT